MSLPAYAEELRLFAEQARTTAEQYKLGRYIINNLGRILRDAEIAEACRAYVRAIDAGDGQEMSHAEVEMFDLIAKDPT